MILHPGALALVLGSVIVLVMMVGASWIGIRVLATWDFGSSSEQQLALERRTSLVSALASYALGFEVVSGLLLVYTVEDIHELFVGAMCATGSLNANPVGWSLLAVKMLVVLMAGVWIAFNHLDQKAGDFPIIRGKYLGLVLLTPLIGVDLLLALRYFGGLEPEVITSCCGSLFSQGGEGLASEVAGLPVVPTMWAFYLALGAFLVTVAACLRRPLRVLRSALSVLAVGVLGIGLASSVAFVSLYVYQLPTHHCPFDMFKPEYHGIGYLLYGSLFGGVYLGLLPGLAQRLARTTSLATAVAAAEPRWLKLSLASILVFTGVASWPVLFGTLSLVGH